MSGWIILLGLVLFASFLVMKRVMLGRRRPGYLAVVEYWVYSNAQRVPPTEALMDSMVSKNPFNKPGLPCITAREGILFSDIRLHIAIARREKNPSAFRPDLFEENVEPNAEVLERLSKSTTIAKVRYASEVPLVDKRHLQFVTHLAATLARLLRGQLIFDTVTEKFWLTEELNELLDKDSNAERTDLHLRTLWKKDQDGCHAETLGLRKVGLDELKSDLQEADHEVLIMGLMREAATRMFIKGEYGLPQESTSFGDSFVVADQGPENGFRKVKLSRRVQL